VISFLLIFIISQDELAVLRASLVAMQFDGRVYDHDLILIRDALELSAHFADCRPRLSDGIHAMLALMDKTQLQQFNLSSWYTDNIFPYLPPTASSSDLDKYIFGDPESPIYITSDDEEPAPVILQMGTRSGGPV
jgi:hypothetical protein